MTTITITITVPRALLAQALDALRDVFPASAKQAEHLTAAIDALTAALAAAPTPQAGEAEPMPSNTRYTVAVEGQALAYYDTIHDAIINAQRAVYSSPDATTRALDDLKAGRLAEWSYGFSAVRIYPPQSKAAPTPQAEEPPYEQCKAIGREPDTHCWDEDTQQDVWSYSPALVLEIMQRAASTPQADALDAARYRLLRSCQGKERDPLLTVEHEIVGIVWGDELDALIDEASRKGEPT